LPDGSLDFINQRWKQFGLSLANLASAILTPCCCRPKLLFYPPIFSFNIDLPEDVALVVIFPLVSFIVTGLCFIQTSV
jgi:hypothetical protein